MIRGTTAQFKFNLPYRYTDLNRVKVVFWQPGNSGPDDERPLPIVKVLGQCSSNSTNPLELCVKLTQEETLRFVDDRKAYVQLRAQAADGNVFASKQETITVYPICDDSVLNDVITPTPDSDGLVIIDSGSIVDWW